MYNETEQTTSVPQFMAEDSVSSTTSEVLALEAETPTFSDGGVFCVAGVRLLGANVPKGDAMDLEVNGVAKQGAVIKLKYGEGVDNYHLAYILGVFPNGVYVGEYNYYRDGKYGERYIPFDDPAILGYWNML